MLLKQSMYDLWVSAACHCGFMCFVLKVHHWHQSYGTFNLPAPAARVLWSVRIKTGCWTVATNLGHRSERGEQLLSDHIHNRSADLCCCPLHLWPPRNSSAVIQDGNRLKHVRKCPEEWGEKRNLYSTESLLSCLMESVLCRYNGV